MQNRYILLTVNFVESISVSIIICNIKVWLH